MQKRKLAKVPIWLRKLSRVKADLRGGRWPRTTEEGLRQAIGLMALAYQILTNQIKTKMPRASKSMIQKAVLREVAHFSKLDARWVQRWKIERKKYF